MAKCHQCRKKSYIVYIVLECQHKYCNNCWQLKNLMSMILNRKKSGTKHDYCNICNDINMLLLGDNQWNILINDKPLIDIKQN